MGSLTGMIQDTRPNLEALVYAVLSGLYNNRRALEYSTLTSRLVWLRALGVIRILDEDLEWFFEWYGRQTTEERSLYYGSFSGSATIGAFVHKTNEPYSARHVMEWSLAKALASNGQKECDLDKLEAVVDCKFASLGNIIDSFVRGDGTLGIECADDAIAKSALTLGVFNLYDEPENKRRLVWAGRIQVNRQERYAYAYLDSHAQGRLFILRP